MDIYKNIYTHTHTHNGHAVAKGVRPSGLRRWRKAPVRNGVGSNPTVVSKCAPVARALSRYHHHLNGAMHVFRPQMDRRTFI